MRRHFRSMDSAADNPLERRVAELRETLGNDHPDMLAAMLDFAEALWPQGRLRQAQQIEEAVVAARRRLLGPHHPDTLKALGKLATTLGAIGELDEARRLQQEIVEGMRR